MQIIRSMSPSVSLVLALLMLMISGPFQPAYAVVIGTEKLLVSARSQEARAYLNQLLAREAVQDALATQGIDPAEAQSRIDSLSDAEAIAVADQFDQLPAGGGFFETLLIVAFLVFLILLITDIAGYTDVFPFAKPMN